MATNGNESNQLTSTQQRAIAALLSSKSVAEAAQKAKVGERTLFRWLDDPTFKVALANAEGELIGQATRRLLQYQDAAITTIATIMLDKQYAASVRLRAAQTVVDTLLRLREVHTFEQRLAALEAKYAEQS